MAFLDNSGDIILDAVLTDTGRLRLAQGDGSFKISKFALGDDEINYGIYNKDHLSGSAYYDLEVLQTPVLEAFTNNTSNLKSKLVTISRTNVLFMPILKLNNNSAPGGNKYQRHPSLFFARYSDSGVVGGEDAQAADMFDAKFYIAADKDTWLAINYYRRTTDSATQFRSFVNSKPTVGLIQGFTADATGDSALGGSQIRIDQGLDTNQIAASIGMDSDLIETAFIVEMDYRLGRVKPTTNDSVAAVNFIDDDNIASYYLTKKGPGGYINPTPNGIPSATNTLDADQLLLNPQVFDGPRSNTLQFRIQASQELQQSTYLFTQLGSSEDALLNGSIVGFGDSHDAFLTGKKTYYLDSTVRVVGANTGYRLDIPVRYIKIK